ncbi:three-prime repair exonuclease 1-like [Anticarsia gemmatalis]|uniref:three-prime repair exonuclease 1-like n=1 Tax=Anticarsia gemmatalis TaxID=129554 RepID=UPI003F75A43C
MVKIATYVFFDMETTGLPYKERNQTKITELSFVVVLRKDLEEAAIGTQPYVSKLTLLLNPQKKIDPETAAITGITNEKLKSAPIFKEKAETILTFLKELTKPICLVAHNGNRFDYPILLAELKNIDVTLPKDLLCVDSLVGFRRMYKEKTLFKSLNASSSFEDSKGSEDWPDLNVTAEDWNDIDILCSSFSEVDPFKSSPEKINNSQQSQENGDGKEVMKFNLVSLYERLLKKDVLNAHRAEDDCMMLLECVTAAKEFLIWTDKYCKNIHDIKPLERK